MKTLLSSLLFAAATPALASVIVYFDAPATVEEGDTFSVNMLADIQDPVLGWGLDLRFDPLVLSQVGVPVIGSAWSSPPPPPPGDGDGLLGLAFPSVSGSNILLATLSFEALFEGSSTLEADVTTGDLTEGFPLIPSGFASTEYVDATVRVTPASDAPAPSIALLFGAGLAGLFARPKARQT
jgi:hypothetical protein